MSLLPIVAHCEPTVDRKQTEQAVALAHQLLREQPRLVVNSSLRPLSIRRIDDRPTLHIDDLTGISLVDRMRDVSFLEDRARLRAADGDVVASCARSVPEFEPYCADHLCLGGVDWLRPAPDRTPKGVASACWTDRDVRNALIGRLRRDDLAYVHPHIGNQAVWALAYMLSRASGKPLQVLAPHPGLTRAVNDKTWFTDVAKRLFGAVSVPLTYRAYNLAGLAHVLQYLARRCEKLAIKIPDAAGGAGTLLIEACDVLNAGPGQLKLELHERLEPLRWRNGLPLLVSSWESNIVKAVSCQAWIPPRGRADEPVVEGLFTQIVYRDVFFVGSVPVELPTPVRQDFIDKSWLLGRLFQELGYVGRCSFDAVLVGRDSEDCRLALIECNGRWGGASVPMTLMNRLFGDFMRQPYGAMRYSAAGLERQRFADVLRHFAEDLYDARDGTGQLIFFSPAGLQSAASIDFIALRAAEDDSAERTLWRFRDVLDRFSASERRSAPRGQSGTRSETRIGSHAYC